MRTNRRRPSRGRDPKVKGYFIPGFPAETRAEMAETVGLAHRLWDLTDGQAGVFRASVFQFRPVLAADGYALHRVDTGHQSPQDVAVALTGHILGLSSRASYPPRERPLPS